MIKVYGVLVHILGLLILCIVFGKIHLFELLLKTVQVFLVSCIPSLLLVLISILVLSLTLLLVNTMSVGLSFSSPPLRTGRGHLMILAIIVLSLLLSVLNMQTLEKIKEEETGFFILFVV